MRGRGPDSSALQELKGNPARRRRKTIDEVVDAGPLPADTPKRRGLSFDPRISLGSILSIPTLTPAIAGFALKYENRITTVENTAAELERR